MPDAFAAASRIAAADSSIATTLFTESARSMANVPTPAYASTTSSLPESSSVSAHKLRQSLRLLGVDLKERR